MKSSTFVLRRPVFYLLAGGLLFFCFATGFLFKEKSQLQEQARQLIILNDSVMSVNIELADSIRRNPSIVNPKNSAFVFKSGLK